MLETFRKYTQGWVATVMGIILSLAFIMWGIENYLNGNHKKDLAAKINGQEITAAQLNAEYQRMFLGLKAQFGANFVLPQGVSQLMRQEALKNLILQNVLAQSAHKAGFVVTPYQVSATIKQMPEFQDKGQFSRYRFEQILARLNYSQQEFVNSMQQMLVIDQVAAGVINTDFLLPNELDRAMVLLKQKRDFAYAILPTAKFLPKAAVTEQEISHYYEQHKESFKLPAKIKIEYLLLSLDDLKKNINISEQELNDYLGAAGAKDQKLITKAKDTLKGQKAEQAFLGASDKLNDLTYTHPESLQDAAETLNLKIATSDYFAQSGGTTPITKNPKVIAAAFSNEILKSRSNSNLIEISPGNVIVLRIKDYQPEQIQVLSAVRDKIKQQLLLAHASSDAKQKGESIIASQSDLHEQLAKEQISLVNKQNVTRAQHDISPQILEQAFNISPDAKQKVVGLQLPNGDYAIISLNAVHDEKIQNINQQEIAKISKQLPQVYGKITYDLYLQDQLDKAKIKTFPRTSN